MDVNAIGMPTNRPVQASPSPPPSEAKSYDGDASDVPNVNTAKSTLPEGVGTKVDKSA